MSVVHPCTQSSEPPWSAIDADCCGSSTDSSIAEQLKIKTEEVARKDTNQVCTLWTVVLEPNAVKDWLTRERQSHFAYESIGHTNPPHSQISSEAVSYGMGSCPVHCNAGNPHHLVGERALRRRVREKPYFPGQAQSEPRRPAIRELGNRLAGPHAPPERRRHLNELRAQRASQDR